VELEKNREELQKRGYGIAAISYDSTAVLKHFADRRGIRFPLLADPDSKIIRAFGIFNESIKPGNMAYGIPHPGLFLVNQDGRVEARYFEDDYRERYTISGILAASFGEAILKPSVSRSTEHLRVSAAAAPDTAAVGQRVLLEVTIEMRPGLHVYAPGSPKDYIPIHWDVEASPAWKLHPATFPQARRARLAGDDVLVYDGRFRVTREITIGPDAKTVQAAAGSAGELVVKGSLRYQACDDVKCFPPETVPLEWRVKVEAFDRQRAPAELQRKVVPTP
jgi:hypothetical protein